MKNSELAAPKFTVVFLEDAAKFLKKDPRVVNERSERLHGLE